MSSISDKKYSEYYKNQKSIKVYPTEFVIRSFLGKYPRLNLDKSEYLGKSILDLGFGDGRNMPFLSDLGFKVHGVEVTETICDHIQNKMKNIEVFIEAKLGRNSSIPYPNEHFDYVLACNSCYYVDKGQRFSDNIKEISRVLKPGGKFIHSLPMGSTFIMDGAINTGDNHMRITNDPYGVRVGAILKKFNSANEIEVELSPWFQEFSIGSCQDDYWGTLFIFGLLSAKKIRYELD